MTEQTLKSLNKVLGSVMSDMSIKWAKEGKYYEWDNQQLKEGKHKLLFGRRGKRFEFRSEWNHLFKSVWKSPSDNKIRISYGLGITHKKMSAKVQRKILTIDEEILKLRKRQQLILARHWNKAKEVTSQQLFNQAKKIRQVQKEVFGIE